MITQEEEESYRGRYSADIKSAHEAASESNRAFIESALDKKKKPKKKETLMLVQQPFADVL